MWQMNQDLLDSVPRSRALGIRIANDMREAARAQRQATRRLADRVRTAEHNSARNGGRLHAVVAVGEGVYRVRGAVIRANPWLTKEGAAKERTTTPVNRKAAARVQLSAARAAVTKGLHNVATQYAWDPPAQSGSRPADRQWAGRLTIASPGPTGTTGARPQLDRAIELGTNG